MALMGERVRVPSDTEGSVCRVSADGDADPTAPQRMRSSVDPLRPPTQLDELLDRGPEATPQTIDIATVGSETATMRRVVTELLHVVESPLGIPAEVPSGISDHLPDEPVKAREVAGWRLDLRLHPALLEDFDYECLKQPPHHHRTRVIPSVLVRAVDLMCALRLSNTFRLAETSVPPSTATRYDGVT